MFGRKRLHSAFETWNQAGEPLASVEARIHDGVPLDKLHDRAAGYLNTLFTLFPQAAPSGTDVVLEVGPGVGYIMQAMMNRFNPARIIGLDVAPAMVEHAKARLTRDQIDMAKWSFETYDGVTMPFEDESIDHLYSVASLQHVPKLYVYHLFAEMARVLRGGYAALQLLSFSFLPKQHLPFATEVTQQLGGEHGHWHHFYSRDELLYVLPAMGAADIAITEHDGSLWVIFRSGRARP